MQRVQRAKWSPVVLVLGLGLAGCGGGAGAAGQGATTAAAPAAKRRIIEITVTEEGFRPERVTVARGEPVTLAFTRTTDETCATEVIIQLGPTDAVDQPLPLHQRVLVDATFATSGDVTYACGMDMVTGVITVK
jgi:plastocyanin domain-containing protein